MNDQLREQQIQQAHHSGNMVLLSTLYAQAADQLEADGDIDAACFYLTQAYVFALDAGLDTATTYKKRLVAHGRDELLSASTRVV
jgi:spore coat protein U-like protein